MRLITSIVVVITMTGCAYHSESFVLLPQADGQPSAIVVTTSKGTHEIATPYAGLELKDSQAERKTFTEDEVQQRFGALLSVPVRPVSHTLFFLNNSTVLTPESQLLIPEIKRDFQGYSAVEILVVGHTDMVGRDKFNDALSLRRAAVVRRLLLQDAAGQNSIVIEARGKREPLLPTADGIAEPRNRRVEITLR